MNFKLIIIFLLAMVATSSALAISIDAPTDSAKLTQNTGTTFELKVSLTETITAQSKCWYNHYTQDGKATMPVYFECNSKSIQVPLNYYGEHTLFVYYRDGDALSSDAVKFSVQQPSTQQVQDTTKQQTISEQPSLVIGQVTFAATCGLDYDKDNNICDSNEDWISCPKDCTFPTVDDLICSNSDNCVWGQSWFIKLLFAGLLLVTIQLVYTDLKMSPNRRLILR